MRLKIAFISFGIFLGLIANIRFFPLAFVSAETTNNDQPQPLDLNDPTFFKLPKEPTYKANKNKAPNKLLKKEEAIAKVAKKADKAELKTWKDFEKDVLSGKGKNDDISPDRQIWIIQSVNQDVKAGSSEYRGATVTHAVDAESGQWLWTKVATSPEKVKNPQRFKNN